MQTSYYNTTETVHPELGRYEEQAKTQEEKLLEWFKYHEQPASPSFACRIVFQDRTPLTSVRRALTNLTIKGELVKTGRQVKGKYGRLEHQWQLAPKYDQRELF